MALKGFSEYWHDFFTCSHSSLLDGSHSLNVRSSHPALTSASLFLKAFSSRARMGSFSVISASSIPCWDAVLFPLFKNQMLILSPRGPGKIICVESSVKRRSVSLGSNVADGKAFAWFSMSFRKWPSEEKAISWFAHAFPSPARLPISIAVFRWFSWHSMAFWKSPSDL